LEQAADDLPSDDQWLDSHERQVQDGLHFRKRRCEWRLGRWTAKLAVAEFLGMATDDASLKVVGIRAASDGSPGVLLPSASLPVSLSLSHRDGISLCAVSGASALGCDLEVIEPHSRAFISDYFTAEEQHEIARVPETEARLLVTLFWSAKESALKALHTGLRLDTRSVSVRLPEWSAAGAWSPLEVRYRNARVFHGWWQHSEPFVRTILADPPPEPPIRLNNCRRLGGHSAEVR